MFQLLFKKTQAYACLKIQLIHAAWPGSQVFRAEAMMLPEKATVETCLGPV